MLFAAEQLARIKAGSIDLAFRRWRRPTVRNGTSLRTAVGLVLIHSITRTDEAEIGEADALRAGMPDRNTLLRSLSKTPDGDLYRIALTYGGPDPREALRETAPADIDAIVARLAKRACIDGNLAPANLLALIRDNAGTRAAELASRSGLVTVRFKAEVRKLKELGLTESLPVGYRLSKRGAIVLAALLQDPKNKEPAA